MAIAAPSNFMIIWLDSEVNDSEENLGAQQQLFHRFDNVEIFEDENVAQEFIESKSHLQILLITSGRLCRKVVPSIHRLEQVAGVYIYCMNKSKHEEWAQGFDKVKAIMTEFDELIQQLKTDIRGLTKNPNPTATISSASKPVAKTDTSTASASKSSSSLQGYKQLPLVTLEETVVPLKEIVTSVDHMVWTVKENSRNPEDGLTPDESAAIALCTMEWFPQESSFSYLLNDALRSENRHQIKPWLSYLKLVSHALSKLKTVSHAVYRGFPGDITGEYPRGKVFTTWEFMSCTSSLKSLEDEEDFGKTGQRTLWTIECRSGKDISRHAYDASKEQVLFPPGRQFKVISYLNAGEELNVVQIEEMKSDYSFE